MGGGGGEGKCLTYVAQVDNQHYSKSNPFCLLPWRKKKTQVCYCTTYTQKGILLAERVFWRLKTKKNYLKNKANHIEVNIHGELLPLPV